MKFVFRVAYQTVVGQSLSIKIKACCQGKTKVIQHLMFWHDSGHWRLELNLDTKSDTKYTYQYEIDDQGAISEEWGCYREFPQIDCVAPEEKVFCIDAWRSAGNEDSVYQGKIFKSVRDLNKLITSDDYANGLASGSNTFCLFMSFLPDRMIPCILGNIDPLGEWDYDRAVPMKYVGADNWQCSVNLPMDWEISYKYGLYDLELGRCVRLEDGAENRVLPRRDSAHIVRISDRNYRRPASQKFRGCGVAVPLFSLRSHKGCGVGEFPDLAEMASWAVKVGLKLLQILPINDTTSTHTWTDSYPYSAISIYALHPIYLRVNSLSENIPNPKAYEETRAALNSLQDLDYEAVMSFKLRVTREVFDSRYKQIVKSRKFLNFIDLNSDWVLDYGVFCVKRDEYATADFSQWKEWAVFDREKAAALSNHPEVLYYVWLQYELDLQLSAAVAAMHEIGIGLKGDLPIGIDRQSVDAWVNPHLFNMDSQTGAPPDAFSNSGQNWGFPTYKWHEMKEDGFAWWQSRFGKLSRYFDAFRIDHILGFFRIWEIPLSQVEGILGHFSPALPITQNELVERGIHLGHDRLCLPFLTESLLKDRFGDYAERIKADFFDQNGEGFYQLKPLLSTQRGIAEFLKCLPEGDWARQDWIRTALFEMVANVILLEDRETNPKAFHPRMNFMETSSFSALDEDQRWRLRALHDDYFYRRHEQFWRASALEKLPAMRAASNMLLCGEDLGMVPACVPRVMTEMGILSLEIQRWPKTSSCSFAHPDLAPYLSILSTGTHDMETLRGWWRSDSHTRASFSWEMLGQAYPQEDLSAKVAMQIIEQHLHSPAMWAIFPLQDLMAIDENLRSDRITAERINDPAFNPFYWKWRMEKPISQLIDEESWNKKLGSAISLAGRDDGE